MRNINNTTNTHNHDYHNHQQSLTNILKKSQRVTGLEFSSTDDGQTDSTHQLGISSPALNICLNFVPDKFFMVNPFDLA